MSKNRLHQKNAFEWDVSPIASMWGKKLRQEFDFKKGVIIDSKIYFNEVSGKGKPLLIPLKIYEDKWKDEYEGVIYNDKGGREYLTRRSQYWKDSLSGKGRFSNQEFGILRDKDAPVSYTFEAVFSYWIKRG